MDNTATLVGYYGGDKTHSLAAWSSTFLELGIPIPTTIEDRVDVIVEHILSKGKRMRGIKGLLSFLATNQHATPFEFSFLHFVTNEDYKSHIHLLKHRIGHAKNTESTRYKERVQDKFLIPDDWDEQTKSALLKHTEQGNKLYHEAIKNLTPLLGRTRAKESAAYFLTINNQVFTNDAWNFRSFVLFQQLRNSPHAQKEIKDLAQCMLEEVKNIPNNPFEYSLKAFNL